MKGLTDRQREILDFITMFIDQTGVQPTYREIGEALGIRSLNGVSDHLKAIERKGFIERNCVRGAPRSLRLTSAAQGELEDGVTSIPLLGSVAAGVPLLASENYDTSIRIDNSMLPSGGDLFALKVSGESMIEDGICDGDTLFVQKTQTARDGEIAVVLVDDEATVKRIYREGSTLRLQPSNSDMSPIIVDRNSGDVSILGVAVGVFRRIR